MLAGVVVLKDLDVVLSVLGPAVGPVLAHADAVSPSSAVEIDRATCSLTRRRRGRYEECRHSRQLRERASPSD